MFAIKLISLIFKSHLVRAYNNFNDNATTGMTVLPPVTVTPVSQQPQTTLRNNIQPQPSTGKMKKIGRVVNVWAQNPNSYPQPMQVIALDSENVPPPSYTVNPPTVANPNLSSNKLSNNLFSEQSQFY